MDMNVTKTIKKDHHFERVGGDMKDIGGWSMNRLGGKIRKWGSDAIVF